MLTENQKQQVSDHVTKMFELNIFAIKDDNVYDDIDNNLASEDEEADIIIKSELKEKVREFLALSAEEQGVIRENILTRKAHEAAQDSFDRSIHWITKVSKEAILAQARKSLEEGSKEGKFDVEKYMSKLESLLDEFYAKSEEEREDMLVEHLADDLLNSDMSKMMVKLFGIDAAISGIEGAIETLESNGENPAHLQRAIEKLQVQKLLTV